MDRFRYFLSAENDEYYFHLTSKNGRIVLQSEGYKSAAARNKGVEAVKHNGRYLDNYHLHEAVNKQWYFVIKAQNGEIIAVSETYTTKSNAKRATLSISKLLNE